MLFYRTKSLFTEILTNRFWDTRRSTDSLAGRQTDRQEEEPWPDNKGGELPRWCPSSWQKSDILKQRLCRISSPTIRPTADELAQQIQGLISTLAFLSQQRDIIPNNQTLRILDWTHIAKRAFLLIPLLVDLEITVGIGTRIGGITHQPPSIPIIQGLGSWPYRTN